jgi:hypothetical protein
MVALFAACFFAAGASPAHAAIDPPPYLDGTYASQEEAMLNNLVDYLVPAYTETGGVMAPGHALPLDWEWLLADVAEAGGTDLLPAAVATGPVGLAVTATLVLGGSLIYMHWFKGDDNNGTWTNASCRAANTDDPSTCRLGATRWIRQASAAAAGAVAWEWQADHVGGSAATKVYDPAGCNSYLLTPNGYPCNIDGPFGRDFTREMAQAVMTVSEGSYTDIGVQHNVSGFSGDDVDAHVRWRPSGLGGHGELMPGLHLDYIGSTPAPGTYSNTQTFSSPTPTHNAGQVRTGLQPIIGAQPPGPGNRINCGLDAVNWMCPGYTDPVTDPGGPITEPGPPPPPPPPPPEFTPFRLPAPTATETYQEYVARLRALGWLGTAQLSYEADLEASAQPDSGYALQVVGAPTTITLPGVSPFPFVVPIYAPSGQPNTFPPGQSNPNPNPDPTPTPGHPGWPTPAPVIPDPTTPIRIRIKPPDTVFPVVPPPGGGGGGSCDCTVASLVFPSVAFPCDKFPFGIFCWVGGQLGNFFSQPAIPWHVTVHLSDVPLAGGLHMPDFGWDFASHPEYFDPFFTTARTILGFLLWVWGLWVYGKRKFGGAGLPDGGEGELEDVGS